MLKRHIKRKLDAANCKAHRLAEMPKGTILWFWLMLSLEMDLLWIRVLLDLVRDDGTAERARKLFEDERTTQNQAD